MQSPSAYSIAPDLTGAWRAIASFLLGGLLTVLQAAPALASTEFAPSSVGKGMLLVASPSLADPNFRQAVVLVVEHGSGGTVGHILNRSTHVLLSTALPEIAALKAPMIQRVARESPVLVECAPYQGPRSTGAVEDQSGRILER